MKFLDLPIIPPLQKALSKQWFRSYTYWRKSYFLCIRM